MPTSAYSEYKDLETGQIIYIPDLTSDAIELEPQQIKAWVDTGIVPQNLYDADIEERRKMNEIRERVENGEKVLSNELPKPSGLLEFLLVNKTRLYGESFLQKTLSNLKDEDPDIVWLHFIKKAVLGIISEDPLPIHHYAARQILKTKYGIEDKKLSDILARELLDHCEKISNFKSFKHPILKKHPLIPKDLELHFQDEKDEFIQLDAEFIKFLESIGKKGKELATKVMGNCRSYFEDYKKNGYSKEKKRAVWGLWILNSQDETEHKKLLCPFMIILAQVIWEDKCARKVDGSPALVKPILEKMIPILKPKKSGNFIEKEGHIIFHSQKGEPLLTAPAVDVNMISAFKKGVKELGTLTGHKLIRWQVNSGFERWQKGEKDPRLIEINGGYSKIAELTRCGSKTDIAKIKEILHTQAHGYFVFPDGSKGNMITLRVLEKYKNDEPSKISIVLGDMLLPSHVCQYQGSERRLIPIGDLPPLHGSPNTHASQAQLQLLIFSEFSNQSIKLAESGYVIIPLEKWEQLAHEAGLNENKIKDIIRHWCQPDLFNTFLEKQGDEYRLTSYYKRQQKFLEIQGEGRIINSKRGKRSAENNHKNSKIR